MCKISCNLGLLSDTDSSKNAVGHYAVSLAGHDNGKIYLVVGVKRELGGAQMLLLADGKSRPCGNPKAKKPKHVCVLKCMDEAVAGKLQAGERVDDSVLIHSLRELGKSRT